MNRASAFVYIRSIMFQPSGTPSPVQSFGSASESYFGPDLCDLRVSLGSPGSAPTVAPATRAGDRGPRRSGRSASVPPAQHAFADPLVSPAASRQFPVCTFDNSPSSTSGLLASMARNCGAKPWSEPTNVVVFLPASKFCASSSVSSASSYAARMNASRWATRPSGVPFDLHVVERGVRCATGQCRRDEAEELVLELVDDGDADEREVGLVGVEDVFEDRVVRSGPVQALLHVRLFAHDPRFEHREVGRGRRRELLARGTRRSRR